MSRCEDTGRRDRIDDPLQYEVIQGIFAAGLILESTAGLSAAPQVCRRIQEAIGELDEAIREIRNMVFGV